jgi:hypothetical protein
MSGCVTTILAPPIAMLEVTSDCPPQRTWKGVSALGQSRPARRQPFADRVASLREPHGVDGGSCWSAAFVARVTGVGGHIWRLLSFERVVPSLAWAALFDPHVRVVVLRGA